MAIRMRTGRAALLLAIATTVASAAFMVPFGGTASAATTVNIPAGNPTDGQTITVSGTGFPVRSALPSGLEIIECTDPGGAVGSLPTDASTDCDGTTVSGGQINTDASGNFTAQYPIELLNSSNSSINCDATDFCVLWVGEDYNNAFLSGPHGFSSPFEIQSVPPLLSEAPVAIALPVIAAAIVGAYVFLRRRRSQAPVTP
jgi:hypothetical protein